MYETIQGIAKRHGFEFLAFLDGMKVVPLNADSPIIHKVVLLAGYPYAPHAADERIPAYYLASNRAYASGKRLLEELQGIDPSASSADIKIKRSAEKLGAARIGRNGLLHTPDFGTRLVFMTIGLNCVEPLDYTLDYENSCGNCGACKLACPAHAITDDGVDYSKCMRAYMNSADHPDEIKERLTTFMGCEVCQVVCRHNSHLAAVEPDEAVKEAFDLKALLSGDCNAARALVGKNKSGNGKLTAEAIAFAKRLDGYDDLVKGCLSSEFDAVVNAAKWYFDDKQ